MTVLAGQLQRGIKSSLEISTIPQVNNPVSVHGIYPYRGKISAIDATKIVQQLKPGKTMLDPFCGSGTIVLEGQRFGIETYGFDTNPLAIWISSGKLDLVNRELDDIKQEVSRLISKVSKKSGSTMPKAAAKHFHAQTAKEIMSLLPQVCKATAYVKASFWGTVALAARGCNHYMWTSSTVGKDINPKRYINFYEKFFYKSLKHYSQVGNGVTSRVFQKDSRKLSKHLKPKSIDYVFTSPPYFDALDYSAYYAKIIYTILGMDRGEIKEGLIQSTKTYENDMKAVLAEIIKVTHKKSLIIFVVGDKKTEQGVLNGGEFFSKLLEHSPNSIIERSYTNSSSQVFDTLNRTKRKEQIVVWDRGTW